MAMILFTLGFLITAFGVGGIETSLDDAGLFAGALVSVIGLMVMGCGVLQMRIDEHYGR